MKDRKMINQTLKTLKKQRVGIERAIKSLEVLLQAPPEPKMAKQEIEPKTTALQASPEPKMAKQEKEPKTTVLQALPEPKMTNQGKAPKTTAAIRSLGQ